MVFYAAFNGISVISRRQLTLFTSFLGLNSTRLGSEVSCLRTLPQKNTEDPVRLEPRTPALRVKLFTTEPRGTPSSIYGMFYSKNLWNRKTIFLSGSFIPLLTVHSFHGFFGWKAFENNVGN